MKHKIKMTLALSSLLTSCTLIAPVKVTNDNNYLLNSTPHVTTYSTHPITLLVMPTQTNGIYYTTKMAYSTRPHQITYFAKSRWAESPTSMIQPLIIQTLQNTHYFRAVISATAIGNYDYILNSQLLELQQDFTHKPSFERMGLRVQLTRVSDNKIIAVREFNIDQDTTQETPCGGALAANQATANILHQLSQFIIHSVRP